MDKYQEDLMSNISFAEFDLNTMKYVSAPYENNILRITQNEDITHTKYIVYLEGQTNLVSRIEVYENDKFRKIEKISLNKYSEKFNLNREEHVIEFDFDNPIITKIKIHFENDLADPLEIPVEYIFADKEKYYYQKEQERINELIRLMRVTHSCGSDLVNIKFQNCSEKVVLTKISLFDDKKQLMGVFKVDEGMFYKSITNLAYGKYFYKAQQLDKENNVIVETDFVEFVIRAPYYGKPFVCN